MTDLTKDSLKSSMAQRKILATVALPYANADLHLGHMLEHVQTNIWTRFQKMQGHQCICVCGDDAHGTAITISADKRGITAEKLINEVHRERLKDFHDFYIDFDHYHTTHSKENKELSEEIYLKLKKAGHITKRTITQAFDPEKQMFLADRYIKGKCPKCNTPDQYGDNCEVCGATYSATDLKDAYSVLSGAAPIKKNSEHFFFQLSSFTDMLKTWTTSGTLSKTIANKLNEWLDQGLHDWDISRDAPYFGFEIPGEKGKYFYVWLDAPIGYMASFKHLCNKNRQLNFDEYWQPNSTCEVHHFIGKDIINFHCLFWPAMLTGAGYRTPTKVQTHGYLTINGEKMSKSRGTFIRVRTYLDYLDPEYLRYYFATKLNSSAQDQDLNLDDFVQRFNSDIIGKLVNLASRCAGFINKQFNGHLSTFNLAPELISTFQEAQANIAKYYEQCEFSKAMRKIMTLADMANAWIDQEKPWIVAKDKTKSVQLHEICSTGLNLFYLLLIYIKPVMPKMVEKAEVFLNVEPLSWSRYNNLLTDHKINKFKPLMVRIEQKIIDKMIEASKADTEKPDTPKNNANTWIQSHPVNDEIGFDDFSLVDMRVANVVSCSAVEGSDKLLKFEVDLGEGTNRTIFSGIKNAYNPDELTGKKVIVVANLKPRKMRFGISQGMIVCAGGDKPYLLEPHQGAEPGMPVN